MLSNTINIEAISSSLKDSVNTAAKRIKRCCSKTDTLKAYIESTKYCYRWLLEKINCSLQGSTPSLQRGDDEREFRVPAHPFTITLRCELMMCPKRWACRWTINITTNAPLAKTPYLSPLPSFSEQNNVATTLSGKIVQTKGTKTFLLYYNALRNLSIGSYDLFIFQSPI